MTSEQTQMHPCIQCGKLLPVQGGCVVCSCGTTEIDFGMPLGDHYERLAGKVAWFCERSQKEERNG